MAKNPFAVALARARQAPSAPSLGGARLVPIAQNNIPQWSEWGTRRAIEEGIKANSVVYACVSKRAAAAASVPWTAEVRQGDEWVPVDDHPLTQLLEHPNSFMSRQDWIERTVQLLDLAGNAMTSKVMLRGLVVELWPIWELDKIQPVPSQTDFLARYDFRRDGGAIPIMPDEVMHLMYPDPGNPFWGMAPLKAAAHVVDTDVEAVRWNKVMLQNRAVGDGVFVFDQLLDRTQWEEARMMVREQHAGADNARAPWVLGGGSKYHPMSRTPVEMDWVGSRALNRKEIASVFGVPLPMIGDYDDATLANIETARRIFWEDTIIPLLDDIAGGINAAITPHFGDPATLRAHYVTKDVPSLREDIGKKIDQYAKLVANAVPPNVAAKRVGLGLDPIPGGDVGFIPATMTPLTMAGEGSEGGDPPEQL